MIQYACVKAFIENQQERMFKSLGIEPERPQEYPEAQCVRKTWHSIYAERVGTFLIRFGEKLLQSDRKNPISEEAIS